MDRIRIRGGHPLAGKIAIGGAKNAALPLMVASLLTDETLVLKNLPRLADITTLSHLLVQHGVSVTLRGAERADETGHVLHLNAARIVSTTAPYDLVRKMRASVLVLGPLRCARGRGAGVAAGRLRHRHAAGRSAHQAACERLGATVELSQGYIERARRQGAASAPRSCFRWCRSAPPRT